MKKKINWDRITAIVAVASTGLLVYTLREFILMSAGQ